jgi:hypothetical protein
MRTLVVELPGPYSMPRTCASCGELAGVETVSVGQSNAKGTRGVNLLFPVCDACHSASKVHTKLNVGSLAGIPAFFVIYGLAMGLTRIIDAGVVGCLGLIAATVGAVLIARLVNAAVAERRMDPSDVGRAKALAAAVKMPSMHLVAFGKSTVTLQFANDAWGAEFAALNAPWIVK